MAAALLRRISGLRADHRLDMRQQYDAVAKMQFMVRWQKHCMQGMGVEFPRIGAGWAAA